MVMSVNVLLVFYDIVQLPFKSSEYYIPDKWPTKLGVPSRQYLNDFLRD